MITKLESAGLGFYVKATEAQEKLGRWLENEYILGLIVFIKNR